MSSGKKLIDCQLKVWPSLLENGIKCIDIKKQYCFSVGLNFRSI